MTYSYDPALATDLDMIRFKLGDTDPDFVEFQDETITAMLAVQGTVQATAVALAKAAQARYARIVSSSTGPYSEQQSDIFKHWQELTRMLTDELTGADGVALATPAFSTDALNREDDRALFDRHMMESDSDKNVYDDRDWP